MKNRRISTAVAVLVLVLALPALGLWALRRTIPPTDGAFAVSSLHAEVRIEQDSWGVPRIRGESLEDVVRGQGWVVARDRLFQMDLIRRKTEGSLAAVLGPKLLPYDKTRRTYGFARVADEAVKRMDERRLAVLQAFADGVNAFLASGPLPPEIQALRYKPELWRPRDSVLAVLAMYDPPGVDFEIVETELRRALPAPVVDFLTGEHGFLDAPLIADPRPLTITVPPASVWNARVRSSATVPTVPSPWPEPRPQSGSNAWALAGAKTTSGTPMLAGDPHLGLNVPNVWYRLRLEGGDLAVTGVALPGVPGIVIGSNGDVAWSLTNALADTVDRIPLTFGKESSHYLDEQGHEAAFVVREESIEVKGAPTERITVRETKWGPVLEGDGLGTYALQWVALDPDPLSRIDAFALNRAKDLPSTLAAFSEWSGPVHNAIFATRDGHIGWVIAGNIPDRVGFDGAVSQPRDGHHYWRGYIPFAKLPKVIDPKSGFLVSANQRPVPVDGNLRRLGANWSMDGRAFRIQSLLAAQRKWDAVSTSAVQLDIVSNTHKWYREQLLALRWADDEWTTAAMELVKAWDGTANADSRSYAILRAFRNELVGAIYAPIVSLVPLELQPYLREELRPDAVVKTLLEKRPMHFLDPQWANYDELITGAFARAVHSLAHSPKELGAIPWGERNRARIRHPFSAILPSWLAGFVNMPASPQNGDIFVPRDAKPEHGASMRMVVDLAESSRSLYAQPVGQSGHFLSPHYRDQHDGWLHGRFTAFEPGTPDRVAVLRPSRGVSADIGKKR